MLATIFREGYFMATNSIWIPTSNVLMNGNYTGKIKIGSTGQEIDVVLDLGSSTIAVGLHAFDPNIDSNKTVTKHAQFASYGNGAVGWYGGLLETTVALGPEGVEVKKCTVVATSLESQPMYGAVGGVLGLASTSFNQAYKMTGSTWPLNHSSSQIMKFGEPCAIAPCMKQLARGTGIPERFAFYSLRSWPCLSSKDPESDPMNHGWLILGGGYACSELYTGDFQNAKLVGSDFGMNLKAVALGDQPVIEVARTPNVAPGTPAGANSVVDFGTKAIQLEVGLFNNVFEAIEAIDPELMKLIDKATTLLDGSQGTVPNGSVNLSKWPVLQFIFEGEEGDVTLTVGPETYWQTDAIRPGEATFTIGARRGPTVFGLPLLNNYFTVFDQQGSGSIGFAKIAQSRAGALPKPNQVAA
jgi:hypothetical protein